VTWFKVDDSFYDHPKIFDAPDCAVALWTRAGSWSARNLTDGFVPANLPARLCDDPERAIKELIERGLWKRTKGGYRFHDWFEYQPSRSDVIGAQVKKASGGVLGNHLRWHVKKGVQNPDCQYCQEKDSSVIRSVSDRSSESGPNPDPTRPDPKEKTSTSPGGEDEFLEDFEEFWANQPHRKTDSKHKSKLAYNAARRRGVAHDVIMSHSTAYRNERRGQEPDYTKGVVVWLNARPWDNGPEPLIEAPRRKFAWEN
jgi:hypothetical protein